MAIEPGKYEGGSLLDYVDAAIEGMKDDLMPADLGVIGAVRAAAMGWDKAIVDGNTSSVMNYLSYVTNGIEKLGGSALARKQLGVKAEKPKTGLAAVRGIRDAPSAVASDAKPATTRKPRAPRAKGA